MPSSVQPGLSAHTVRANDPDRYLLATLAPGAVRDALFAVYAFNVEIARTREMVSEAMLGEIRLQWWRDEIEAIYAGSGLRHAVAENLSGVVASCGLTRAHFDRLIDARADDLDDGPPENLDALLRYAEETSAPLLALALEIHDSQAAAAYEAARRVGVAWSLLGLVRAMPFHLRARRRFLPDDLLGEHGVVLRDMLELRTSEALRSAVRDLARRVEEALRMATTNRHILDKGSEPVLLQARLAQIHLRRLAACDFDPFDPRLAAPAPMAAWRLGLRKLFARY